MVFLGVITILAAILRFYQLGQVPSSLEWDEVALGYDAYSILKTGRDQFGQFLPVTFRSLDDYKPPIYEYLAVPSVFLFGLNAFSTRLPSALAGIGTIVLVYFFTKLIFSQLPMIKKHSVKGGLLAAFLLAVSPWHIQFSRAAFEVNVACFITLLAVFFFLKGLKNSRFFILSAVFFGLDLFSYHSARVVAPLLLLSLLIIFNQNLPSRKTVLTHLLIFGIFLLAVLPILRSKDAQIRFRATNIFRPAARYLNELDLDKIFLDKRLSDTKAGYTDAGKIFHNQRFIFFDYIILQKAFNNYLSNFGFEYLFIKGDAPLHHAPDFGLFHLLEFPFLVAGLLFLLFKGFNRYSLFLFAWLLIAPLPNAVTREAPHSVRTLLILPVYQIISAGGLILFYSLLKNQKKWVYLSFYICLAFIFAGNHGYYLHQYYVHTNLDVAANWKYGRKEAVAFTEKVKNKYDKILVSLTVDMPYIFWLY
ncbi:hypothetical protein A2W14_01925, partial [Candidatus Gottesmanbacteria bacterium RBG_16_37_8]